MQVETFECTETAAEPIETSQEAIALIEALGLEGQKSIIGTADETSLTTRSPYRKMTADELFVYRQLCPEVVDLSKYDGAPIPVRVLQVAAHAKECGLFKKLVVWDKASALVHDPVLVGVPHSAQDWSRGEFILARWGEHLETFSTMLRQALEQKREWLRQEYRSKSAKARIKSEEVDSMTDAEVMSDRAYI